VLDAAEVDRALALDPAWAARLRALWLALAAAAVFGVLHGSHVGALPRVRKQVLDAGERLRALFADRAWIPRLREALDALETAAQEVKGDDGAEFRAALADLRAATLDETARRANQWAALLDRRASDEDNAGSDPIR